MTATPYEPARVVLGMTTAGEEPEATRGYEPWTDDDRDVDYDELGGES
jgi:hypothetical protein